MADELTDRKHFCIVSKSSVLAISLLGMVGCLNSDSDGDGSSGNEPMTLSGLARTGPIDGGDVTLSIGEDSYTGETSSTGEFSVEIPGNDIADLPGDAYVTIRVKGSSDANQEHLEFLSHLGNWSQIESLAGESWEVTEDDLTALYVGSIQTALATEAIYVNDGDAITSPSTFSSALRDADGRNLEYRLMALEMLAQSGPEALNANHYSTLDLMAETPREIRHWAYDESRSDLNQTTKEQIASSLAIPEFNTPDGYSYAGHLNVKDPEPGPIQISQEGQLEQGVYRDTGIDRASVIVDAGSAHFDFTGDLSARHVHSHEDDQGQYQLTICLATYEHSRITPIARIGNIDFIAKYTLRRWEHNSTGIAGIDTFEETIDNFTVERVIPSNQRDQFSNADWGESMWMLDWRNTPEDSDQYSFRSPLIVQLRPEDQIARIEYGGWHSGESVSLDTQSHSAALSIGTDQLVIRPVNSTRQAHFEADVVTKTGDADSRGQWAENVSVFSVDPEAHAWGTGALVPGLFVHDMLGEPPAIHPSDWYGIEVASGGEANVFAYNYLDSEWYLTSWSYGWDIENGELVLRRCEKNDDGDVALITEDPAKGDCPSGFRRITYTLDHDMGDGHVVTRRHVQQWISATSFHEDDSYQTDSENATVLRRFETVDELPIHEW